MIVEELKKSILNYAMEGKIGTNNISDGNVNDIYKFFLESLKNTNSFKKVTDTLKPVTDVPFKIPNNWRWLRLGNIIRIHSGDGLVSKNMIEGTIPVYGGNGITGYHNSYNINKKTIVIGRVGFYCGSIHITEEQSWVTDNAFIVDYPEEFFDIDYLAYLLKYLNLGKHNSSTAQPVISGNKIYNILCPIAPLEEQKRIVEKIDDLFFKLDKIAPLEEEIKCLKSNLSSDMKKAILDYAIHGNLSNQSTNDSSVDSIIPKVNLYSDNAKKFNLTINENEFPFKIPSNWRWVKLGMLFNYQNGYSYKPSETVKNGKGYPVIKSQNIMKRIVEINNQTSFVENPTEQMLKSKINKGDFLMCLSSQSNNPEPLGKTAIYEDDNFALLNQRVLKLTPFDYRISKYLYYVINSFYFHNTVSNRGGGSAQSNLKLEHVMEMYIPLPPLEEQDRIVGKIENLLPLLDNIDCLMSN